MPDLTNARQPDIKRESAPLDPPETTAPTDSRLVRLGLVLEGGGMRGLFTCGVIDVMMEQGLHYDGLVGVSAGAAFGCNYKSRQPGRVIRYQLALRHDRRYMGLWSWLTTGDYVGSDYAYHEVPTLIDYFDSEAYDAEPMEMHVVCTDATTGRPVYRRLGRAGHETFDWIRASASLPLVSRTVRLDGMELLDGGMVDAIPLDYFERQGFSRNVVVLTQPRDYQKPPASAWLFRTFMPRYPQVALAMARRHTMYNRQLALVSQAEAEGRCLVIRPDAPLGIGRMTQRADQMKRCYEQGRDVAERIMPRLKAFVATARSLSTLVVMILTWLTAALAARQPQGLHATTRPTPKRPTVALVIGGGGAKGAAAIGVLHVVEQAKLPIDLIVGTSAGAIVGALYAAGHSAAEIDSLYRAQDWRRMLFDPAPPRIFQRGDLVRPRDYIPGLMSADRFRVKLDSLLDHQTFEQLSTPFCCMAVDALHFCEVRLDSGNVAEAVRASMSVPIAFRAVERDSMALVDGGLLNNLPVDAARALGADIVVAIDLMDARRASQETRHQIRSRGLPAIIAWQFARPDLDKYRTNRADADLLIHPDVSGFSGTSFAESDTEQLIANGVKAGREVWTILNQLVDRINSAATSAD